MNNPLSTLSNPTRLTSLSTSSGALMVGVSFIVSIVLVTFIDDFLLPNFVIPGDTATLAADVDALGPLFTVAIACYLVVLILDTVIGIGFFVVLKHSNIKRAMLVAALRIAYAGIVAIGLIALALQLIDVYDYGTIKLFGYACFAMHLLALAYACYYSGYIPKFFGLLLAVAALTYIVFFIDAQLPSILNITIMATMAMAELSLCVWLLINRHKVAAASA